MIRVAILLFTGVGLLSGCASLQTRSRELCQFTMEVSPVHGSNDVFVLTGSIVERGMNHSEYTQIPEVIATIGAGVSSQSYTLPLSSTGPAWLDRPRDSISSKLEVSREGPRVFASYSVILLRLAFQSKTWGYRTNIFTGTCELWQKQANYPSLPQRIDVSLPDRPDAAIHLDFAGPERKLIVTLGDTALCGPLSDYELYLYVVRGAVGTLTVSSKEGAGFSFGMIGTLSEVGGKEYIRNPALRLDGKEEEIVKGWRRLGRLDKRFVIKQRR